MFLEENSRYAKTKTIKVTKDNGKEVSAVKLRKLAITRGQYHNVKQNDRLDILAGKHYDDATKFWHIADANTALQANHLIDEMNVDILVPES